ncbi:hypothetical protein L0F51_04115 [Afifella sp. H1R]|uniref:hypothetical protein n=1 Tax=Afifella sp. H1R TaxID=2908841 RepID=UPI001F266C4D|nr:hypothetical protein [Afifella sp. H1R]MCF1502950.1 hypothetical protein [Afifella sp. H1R]
MRDDAKTGDHGPGDDRPGDAPARSLAEIDRDLRVLARNAEEHLPDMSERLRVLELAHADLAARLLRLAVGLSARSSDDDVARHLRAHRDRIAEAVRAERVLADDPPLLCEDLDALCRRLSRSQDL